MGKTDNKRSSTPKATTKSEDKFLTALRIA